MSIAVVCIVVVVAAAALPLWAQIRDFDTANSILPSVPREQYNNIARFLESQGYKEEALSVADDPDVKFDLALQLNKLEVRSTPTIGFFLYGLSCRCPYAGRYASGDVRNSRPHHPVARLLPVPVTDV